MKDRIIKNALIVLSILQTVVIAVFAVSYFMLRHSESNINTLYESRFSRIRQMDEFVNTAYLLSNSAKSYVLTGDSSFRTIYFQQLSEAKNLEASLESKDSFSAQWDLSDALEGIAVLFDKCVQTHTLAMNLRDAGDEKRARELFAQNSFIEAQSDLAEQTENYKQAVLSFVKDSYEHNISSDQLNILMHIALIAMTAIISLISVLLIWKYINKKLTETIKLADAAIVLPYLIFDFSFRRETVSRLAGTWGVRHSDAASLPLSAIKAAAEEVIHPDDRLIFEQLFSFVEKKPNAGIGMITVDYRLLEEDGTYRWHRCTAKLVRNPKGQPVSVLGMMMDIDELKWKELELDQNNALLREALFMTNFIVCQYDLRDDTILFAGNTFDLPSLWNESSFTAFLDKIGAEIHPEDMDAFFHAADGQNIFTHDTGANFYDFRMRDQDENWSWRRYTIRYRENTDGTVIGGTLVFIDIDSLKRRETELASAVYHDALTGLYNRAYYDDWVPKAYAAAARNSSWISGILIDVDNFKRYNDSYGHQKGDQCLTEICQAIRAQVKRPLDAVIRLGGEEIFILLPDTDEAGACRVADNIVKAVEKLKIPHVFNQPYQYATISAGVASIIPPMSGTFTCRQFFNLIDNMLYEAKQSGKNKWVLSKRGLKEPLTALSPSPAALCNPEGPFLLSSMASLISSGLAMEESSDAIAYIMEKTGRLLDVSRVFLFEADSGGQTFSNTEQWCNYGVESLAQRRQNLRFDEKNFEDAFKNHQPLVHGAGSTPNAALYQNLLSGDSDTQLIFELSFEKQALGFMGLEEDRKKRMWNQDEGICLALAANVISMLIASLHCLKDRQRYEAAMKALCASVSDTIYITDPITREILFTNTPNPSAQSGQRLLCYQAAGAGPRPCSFCAAKPAKEETAADCLAASSKGEFVSASTGKILEARVSCMEWLGGRKVILCVQRDISAEKRHQAEVEDAFEIDKITGLKTRFAAQRTMAKWIGQGKNFACALLDLEHFGFFNHNYGGKTGDLLLILVSKYLSSLEKVKVFRWESDTFMLLIEPSGAYEKILETITQRFRRPWQLDGIEHQFGFHCGIALFPSTRGDENFLPYRAELALNQAKISKNSHIAVYNEEIRHNVEKSAEITERIDHAISSGEFEVHYQPIFSVGETCENAEALLRLRDRHGKYIPPLDFIPIAERTGKIYDLGLMALDRVCSLISKFPQVPRIFVNISALQLMNGNFLSDVNAVLCKYGVSGSQIGMEITENELIGSFEQTKNIVQKLSAQGVQFAFDDFGSGYSGIGYLDKLSLQIVKIDKSLTDKITSSSNTQKLVTLIIDIAHQFNMKVVAEGVENRAAVQMLRYIGCDYFQGYYFAKPLPESELIRGYLL